MATTDTGRYIYGGTLALATIEIISCFGDLPVARLVVYDVVTRRFDFFWMTLDDDDSEDDNPPENQTILSHINVRSKMR